jgi:hypothetical protein
VRGGFGALTRSNLGPVEQRVEQRYPGLTCSKGE